MSKTELSTTAYLISIYTILCRNRQTETNRKTYTQHAHKVGLSLINNVQSGNLQNDIKSLTQIRLPNRARNCVMNY